MPVTRILKPLFAFIFFLSACRTTYQPSTIVWQDYRVSGKQQQDSALSGLLKPYTDSVNKNMNDVIAVAGMPMEKKQPEGTLGNLLADAMLSIAEEKYHKKIDGSLINYGGIRLNAIPAGNITRGKIFEISPFDNIVVLQTVNASVLQELLDLTAAKGGWPCAGFSYQIKNNRAVNIVIKGRAFDRNAVYTLALLDYVANGGDDCAMLRNIPQENNGYLFRDALINYFAQLNRKGKQITASIENRVSHAE